MWDPILISLVSDSSPSITIFAMIQTGFKSIYDVYLIILLIEGVKQERRTQDDKYDNLT